MLMPEILAQATSMIGDKGLGVLGAEEEAAVAVGHACLDLRLQNEVAELLALVFERSGAAKAKG